MILGGMAGRMDKDKLLDSRSQDGVFNNRNFKQGNDLSPTH